MRVGLEGLLRLTLTVTVRASGGCRTYKNRGRPSGIAAPALGTLHRGNLTTIRLSHELSSWKSLAEPRSCGMDMRMN